MELVDRAYDLASSLPKTETYELGSQIRRAAVSIPANIAEGHGREHLGEYLHHLSIATGSLMELDTLVRVGVRRGMISAPHATALFAAADDVGRMLGGLTRSLKRLRHEHLTPDT
jgi:four helix bundle protein